MSKNNDEKFYDGYCEVCGNEKMVKDIHTPKDNAVVSVCKDCLTSVDN